MIVKIIDETGKEHAVKVYENNFDGEVEVQELKNAIHTMYGFDDIFDSNDKMITIQLVNDEVKHSEIKKGVKMDVKCKIKKMKEKGYIKRIEQHDTFAQGYYVIETKVDYRKYIERFLRENSNEKILIGKNNDNTNLPILVKEKFIEYLEKESKAQDNENIEIYKSIPWIDNTEFREFINNETRFHFGGKIRTAFKNGFKIIDLQKKAENDRKKEIEKQEFFDLLNDNGCGSIYEELINFVKHNKRDIYEKFIKEELIPILFDEMTNFEINDNYTDDILKKYMCKLKTSTDRHKLIDVTDEYRYIIIDMEAIDKVYGYNNMIDVLKSFNTSDFFESLEPEDEEFIRKQIMEE